MWVLLYCWFSFLRRCRKFLPGWRSIPSQVCQELGMPMSAPSSEDETSEKTNHGYGFHFVLIKCFITMLVYIAKQWINSFKKGLILSTCVIIQGYCNVETLTNHFNMFYFPCIDLIKFVWFDVNSIFKWISK